MQSDLNPFLEYLVFQPFAHASYDHGHFGDTFNVFVQGLFLPLGDPTEHDHHCGLPFSCGERFTNIFPKIYTLVHEGLELGNCRANQSLSKDIALSCPLKHGKNPTSHSCVRRVRQGPWFYRIFEASKVFPRTLESWY